jgi:hypothetical protein
MLSIQSPGGYVGNNIYVQNCGRRPKFLEIVKEAIELISSQEVGKRLITKIGQSRHQIRIIYSSNDETFPLNSPNHFTPGVGCGSRIEIEDQSTTEAPFYIRLAHELIHAYHNSRGRNKAFVISDIVFNIVYASGKFTNAEEYNTIIGLPTKKVQRTKPKITENAIREEHQMPPRTTDVH